MKETKTYYYQEAEDIIKAFIRSARKLQVLAYKGLVPWDSFNDTFVQRVLIQENFSWAAWGKNLSLIGESVKEENLTVEQKNIIASHYKDSFDYLRDFECAISNYINFTVLLTEICKVYDCFTNDTISDENYIEFFQNLDRVTPLALTYDELYYVLSNLPEEEVRSLLSPQPPTVFHKLYAGYKKGGEEFVKVAESLDVASFCGLRQLATLIVKEHIHKDIDPQLDNNLWKFLFEDVIGNDNRLIDLSDSAKLGEYPDMSLFSQEFFMETLWDTMSKLVAFISGLLPKLEKKKLHKVYESLRKQYKDVPSLPETPFDDALNNRFYKLVAKSMDASLVTSIKQLMERQKEETVDCAENSNGTNDTNTQQAARKYVRVISSKIPGTGKKEKDERLKICLEKLYDLLLEKNLLEGDRELFVYRFSGMGKPCASKSILMWKGKNVLLGYIVRCLLSDSVNPPENFEIAANFFESKTGKGINLASAKDVKCKNYENEKKILPDNFNKAVEFLNASGFANVEYTSMRRQKLQKVQNQSEVQN